jgi:hypothetical protein
MRNWSKLTVQIEKLISKVYQAKEDKNQVLIVSNVSIVIKPAKGIEKGFSIPIGKQNII